MSPKNIKKILFQNLYFKTVPAVVDKYSHNFTHSHTTQLAFRIPIYSCCIGCNFFQVFLSDRPLGLWAGNIPRIGILPVANQSEVR
jgi:hypothetical protein